MTLEQASILTSQAPQPHSSRKLRYVAVALIGILALAAIAFLAYIRVVTTEWQALGGTIAADEDPFLGPRRILLGNAIGHQHSADATKVAECLSRMRRLPLCSQLSIAHLPFSQSDIDSMLSRFRPIELTAENVQLTDHGIEQLVKYGTLQKIGLSHCPVTEKGLQILLDSKMIIGVDIDQSDIPQERLAAMQRQYGSRLRLWSGVETPSSPE